MFCRVIDEIKRWCDGTGHPLRFLVPQVLWILAGVAVACLLVGAFVLALHQADGTKASILATIGTGGALLLISARALRLDVLRFFRSKEPFLGVMWKEPGMYPLTEHEAHIPQDVYAEYILWNAGDVPILIYQPSLVLDRRLGPMHLGSGKVEVEHVSKGETVIENSFPIVLGKGEICIWRQFTGDRTSLRPQMSEIIEDSREKAIKFLQKQECNRRFLLEVTYFGKPPHGVKKADLRKQYVGFCYQIAVSRDKRSND